MLSNYLILVLTVLILFVSKNLIKSASGSIVISKLNLISISFFSLVIMFAVGSSFAILGFTDGYGMEIIRQNRDLAILAHFTILYSIIGLAFSMYLIKSILKIDMEKLYSEYIKSPVINIFSSQDSYSYLLLMVLLVLCILAAIYTLFNTPDIPIFHLFSADSVELGALRRSSNIGYTGSSTIKYIFAISLPQVLSYTFYVYSTKYKYLKWKIPFAILLLLTIFMKSYTLEKAPVLLYLIGFLFINILLSKKLKMKKMLMIFIAVSVMILASVMIILQLSVSESYDFVIYRIFTGQLGGLYWQLYVFPRIIPYLGFMILPNWLTNIFNIDTVSSTRVIMELTNPLGIDRGDAGVMSTLFSGEAYAGFGWFGLILGVLYVGVLIETVYILFLKNNKNPLNIASLAYLSATIPAMLISSFTSFLFDYNIICLIILYFGFYLVGLIIKGATKRKFKGRGAQVSCSS